MATETYLSARRRAGRDECVWCDAQGRVQGALPLPARGHSFAIDAPRDRAVVFGRQPGFFAWALRLTTGQGRGPDAQGSESRPDGAADIPLLQPEPLALPTGHHFYGHGVYAPDGQTLYVTENDYVNARGVIGVYDARPGHGHTRIGEFASGGVGPHDIALMPDGHTLCVANGGLQTHPDFGKTILNLATMRSSLTYLNCHTGQVLETHTLEGALPAAWRHLSLRHLAVDGSGQVWVGGQYVNPDGQRPALVWRHVQGQDLQPAPCPPDQERAMRNYVGSVAVNRCGDVVAASSPVGGQVLCWRAFETADAHSARMRADIPALLDVVALPDVCGVAPWGAAGFLFSSGHGALVRRDPVNKAADSTVADGSVPSFLPPATTAFAWDNHLCSTSDASF